LSPRKISREEVSASVEKVEERLASFYLGQEYDLGKAELLDPRVFYDARDLTTHAVCLGMTGSGKTGLGVILLEEAALDGVPSLIIDPKGDMTNLLLTFPDLSAEDFRPWVNPDDARRKDLDLDAYAASIAELWRKGLEGSGQGSDRIRRLRESADFTIFTPGSSAGQQLSILDTLKAPSLSWDTESELLRDKIESIVSALLGLVGIEADPVRSREHILLSNIFEDAWRAGEDLDLAQLILRVQKPPFSQLGVFPVNTFFPEKDRMELAMLLNGLMASPSFADWIQGQPLEIDRLLFGPSGKPQVSILYIAHLSDAEKQFFVTLLLEQVVSWMRAQTGTTSLRALVYMDEVFGYLPPHPSNPPTKKPMLTLLKQARAFGLGLILATQNPVDLDYKALSNAGTWFIGRMQADRDKQRLLDGLEGVEVGEGGTSRAQFDRMISALSSRVFLLHNVHEGEPIVFHTRWAMSYLRGPLTRSQVQQLTGQRPAAVESATSAVEAVVAPLAVPAVPPQTSKPGSALQYSEVAPQLPSAVTQVYWPVQVPVKKAVANLARDGGLAVRSKDEPEGALVYHPALMGLAKLRFAHTKSRQTHEEDVAYLLPVEGEGYVVQWDQARVEIDVGELDRQPERGALYAELPSDLGASKHYTELESEFSDHLYYNSSVTLQYNPHLDLYSEMGESREAFQRRCRKGGEQARDAEAKKVAAKYEQELDRLEDKLKREERELDEDKIEHSARKEEELLSGAESLFGLLTGSRSSRSLSSASRKRRMTRQAKADVKESQEVIKELKEQISEVKRDARTALKELDDKWREQIDEVEEIDVRPRRADVRIDLFALAWLPYWELRIGDRVLSMPAFEGDSV
jgi:DNA helicase HerA-like ATPase